MLDPTATLIGLNAVARIAADRPWFLGVRNGDRKRFVIGRSIMEPGTFDFDLIRVQNSVGTESDLFPFEIFVLDAGQAVFAISFYAKARADLKKVWANVMEKYGEPGDGVAEWSKAVDMLADAILSKQPSLPDPPPGVPPINIKGAMEIVKMLWLSDITHMEEVPSV